MRDHDKEVTHTHKLPVSGCRRFRPHNPGIAGDIPPVAEIDMVLQGNFLPHRAAKDKNGGGCAGPECNFLPPDKDPPRSTRYLFRFRPDRPERICGEFSCVCQDRLPPVRLSCGCPYQKNIQLQAGPARGLLPEYVLCTDGIFGSVPPSPLFSRVIRMVPSQVVSISATITKKQNDIPD